MDVETLGRRSIEHFLASMLGVLGSYDEVHDLNVTFNPPVLGAIEGYYLSSDTMCIYVEYDGDVKDIGMISDAEIQALVDNVIALHNKKFPEFQYK